MTRPSSPPRTGLRGRLAQLALAAGVGASLAAAAARTPPAGPPPEAPVPPGAQAEPELAARAVALLAERCTECHGAEKQKGGLRLDARAALLVGGDSGPAAVPGEPAESELLLRVADEFDRMPPKGEPLDSAQIELLRAWIAAGAPWATDAAAPAPARRTSDHWAYGAPVRPPVPAVSDAPADWRVSPIDAFVAARLAAEGLAPSLEADPPTLLRRASLDLTGLPPSAEERERFLADAAPGAYERLVDRLLGSAHYGEHMARGWLDLARYADSHGFTIDGARSIWPWRDWVVDAFNAGMPFDRFTVLQLAGDLVPDATDADRIATGFHRNTMVNQEGGADDEEYRVAAVVDRVDTTATVWLGTTLACARCHTHKYDPFTQREYFRLFAFLDQTADRGTSGGPTLAAPTPAERAELELLDAEIAALEARLGQETPELAAARAAWERTVAAGGPEWTTPRIVRTQTTGEVSLARAEGGVLVAEGADPETASYTLQLETDLERVTALRLEALADPELPAGGPGRAENGNFVLTRVRADVAPRADLCARTDVAFATPSADFEQHRSETSRWPVVGALSDAPGTGWAILPDTGRDHVAVFPFATPVAHAGGMRVTVTLEQGYGGRHTLGRLRVSVTDHLGPVRADDVPAGVRALLAVPEAERTRQQRARVAAHHRAIAPELEDERRRIAELRATRPRPTTTLVMRAVERPRETRLLRRGSFLDPGEPVTPGTPEVLPPLAVPADRTPTRLDLARWLVSAENPLTARVTVNRLWQQLFGTGLVATPDDFGTRGERPSHPELLDWLAVELVESGWDLKHLLRLVATSRTYRQSSALRPELAERDPQNRLLARQARIRLSAEALRDSLLVASGLLDRTLGGPPVYPPQPDGVFDFTQTPKEWPTSEGPDRWRRSLYTWRWRTSLYPFYATFDAPQGDVTCARRDRSNTPLQALTLANDPMVLELAGGLARSVLATERHGANGADAANRADGATRTHSADGAEPAAASIAVVRDPRDDARTAARLRALFRRALVREPDAAELAVLESFLARQLAAFAADPEAAARFTRIGPGGAAGDALLDPVRLAAWIATARVVLNLDELSTRG